ncbi:MAG: N-methyl-L-tryptophan oxidase [Actinomycetota bacterium]
MERADVVIVGGGVVGLSAAWRLARAGRDVVLLERFSVGHDRGSSHGSTRIFRFAYDDPVYVRLAQAALPLWHELENAAGRALLRITGGMDVGDPTYLDRCASALRSCGARAVYLRPAERRERFPWLEAGDEPSVYSPNTGVLAASHVLETLAKVARAAGARVVEGATCERINIEVDRVIAIAPAVEIEAARCIVAAGGWTADFIRPLGIELPLRVTREQVFYFDAPDDVVPFIHRGAIARYGLPAFDGTRTVKVAEHGTGGTTAADGRSFVADPDGEARLRAYVHESMPTFGPEPTAFETCLYTMTPDEGFVLDARGPIIVASACSGHGFKFAPILGEILASMATGAEPPVPTQPFRLDRFR